jgi:2,4-dichlorophenol 6-monooxygenase
MRTSTIDLVGNGFVLLTPFGGKPWTEAAKYLATEYPLRLKTLMIDDGELMSAYHLDEAGAVLVCPDGYVGWRSRSKASHPSLTLREAMAATLGRTA